MESWLDIMKIAIIGVSMLGWAGGRDFLEMIIAALESQNDLEISIYLSNEKFPYIYIKDIRKFVIQFKGNYVKYKDWKIKQNLVLVNYALDLINNYPKIKVKYFDRYWLNYNQSLYRVLKRNQEECCLALQESFGKNFNIPWIGYWPDLQHKYLSQLYSNFEINKRNRKINKILKNAKCIFVNALEVKRDLEKYFDCKKCMIEVLPFIPFIPRNIKFENNLEDSKLSYKYFMISNQFWMHKDHYTAFCALETLFKKGEREVHIICTGDMQDYRNSSYIKELLLKVDNLECRNNIHFLGYVSKAKQLFLMKNATAIIQPTLFEGGPGGGVVSSALCLGVRCILSDIEVNREISSIKNIYYFNVKNSNSLSNVMTRVLNEEKSNINVEKINSNSLNACVLYGKELSKIVKNFLEIADDKVKDI